MRKGIPFIALALLISPFFASGAHAAITTWEVYTYGTGKALGQIFEAIANVTGSNDFVTLIKIGGIIAILGAALYGALLSERGVKIIASFFALYLMLFSVKTNVAIVDYVDPGANRVINGIPIGLAVPAHLISKIGDALTELVEETFISVDAGYDGVRYGGNGLVGGLVTLRNALGVTFRLYDSPNLRADVDQFIRDCTFQDTFTGHMSWDEIMKSDNLLDKIFDTDSGNITYYHDPEDSATTVTAQCRDLGPILKSRIQAHTDNALQKLKEEVYGDLPVDIKDKIEGAYRYYLDLSWTAKRIIEQNLLMNQLPQSAINFAQATGSDEALLAYNLAVAQEEWRHKAEVEGFYSRKLYPVMRMVLEAICYGIWPFVFIIWLTPFGGTKALRGYIILLLALQLWAPLEAILTLIMNVCVKHNLTTSVNSLNLLTVPHIYNYTASIFAVAWKMQMFIPIIALALATGSEYALTHMFPRLIPQGLGTDVALGNIRAGTTSVDSHSVGVLSAMNWNAFNTTASQRNVAPTERDIEYIDGTPVEVTTVRTPDGKVVRKDVSFGLTYHPGGGGFGPVALGGVGPGATKLVAQREILEYAGVLGLVSKAEQYGLTPAEYGRLGGALRALSGIGRIQAMHTLGDEPLIGMYRRELINEAAKFEIIADLAKRAGLSEKDALFASQGATRSFALTREEAQRITGDPSAMAGTYIFSRTADGKIVATRGEAGKRYTVFDFKEITKGLRRQEFGWSGRIKDEKHGIDYFIVSGDRTQIGNMVAIRGITEQGQTVSLVMDAKGNVVSHRAIAGPQAYEGAIAMVMAPGDGMPNEIFTSKVAAIRFARDYASEFKGLYNVQISRADVDRFFKGLGGGIGGGILLSARGFIDQRWGSNFQTISTRDLAQATAYAILTSKMSISEKKAALRILTDKIFDLSSRKPRELPEGQKFFPEVKSEPVRGPFGPPISTITTQRDTRTEEVMQELGMLRSEKEK